jgi:hypothetical protein
MRALLALHALRHGIDVLDTRDLRLVGLTDAVRRFLDARADKRFSLVALHRHLGGFSVAEIPNSLLDRRTFLLGVSAESKKTQDPNREQAFHVFLSSLKV